VLDLKNIGADALGSASAALAAAATLAYDRGDSQFYTQALQNAEELFLFATRQPGEEKSYCKALEKRRNSEGKDDDKGELQSICSFKVTLNDDVLVQKVKASSEMQDEERVRCWVPDYSRQTCMLKLDFAKCKEAAKYGHVYKR
jgi:hypothetical protein